MCRHACVHVHTCLCACMHVSMCVLCVGMRVYMYIHAFVHVCMCARMHMYVCVYVRACMRACMCMHVKICVNVNGKELVQYSRSMSQRSRNWWPKFSIIVIKHCHHARLYVKSIKFYSFTMCKETVSLVGTNKFYNKINIIVFLYSESYINPPLLCQPPCMQFCT